MRVRPRLGACVLIACVLCRASALRAADAVDPISRVAALARVWGLLKYFHPGVAEGTMSWDLTLVDELPRIQAAGTRASFNDEIVRMIRSAGAAPALAANASLDAPETDAAFLWIDDGQLFDPSTIRELKSIRNAVVSGTNRYVRPVTGIGNPDFGAESPYNEIGAYPPVGYRLLALARFWNMVQYYAPNRDVTDRPWAETLDALAPKFLDAADANAYQLAVCELTASLNDTHAATGSFALSALWGARTPGIRTRYVESQTVITDAFGSLTSSADLRPGDIVTDINGVSGAEARARLHPYVWSSNEEARQRNIDALVFRTNASTTTLGISRFGVRKEVVVPTVTLAALSSAQQLVDAQPAKWRVLDGNIGYVHMGLLLQSDVPAMWAAVANTRAIVFDVRNYPQGTLYLIAQHLNPRPVTFVQFTKPQYNHPGTMAWDLTLDAGPAAATADYYRGKVILLGDERTQSHAEFTMMALRTAPDVTIVGSTTAGADGNVSMISLPGGITTYLSGLGVYYPDHRPTQRVGIVPDIVSVPTIAGIQNGVDEVLERALAIVR